MHQPAPISYKRKLRQCIVTYTSVRLYYLDTGLFKEAFSWQRRVQTLPCALYHWYRSLPIYTKPLANSDQQVDNNSNAMTSLASMRSETDLLTDRTTFERTISATQTFSPPHSPPPNCGGSPSLSPTSRTSSEPQSPSSSDQVLSPPPPPPQPFIDPLRPSCHSLVLQRLHGSPLTPHL